ncbi:MAG: glycosyltransferase family 4 protein [Nostoc sp. TH1S01]|nr:glycosyltransferase family 4 protein [Nostoc sp. TH1S01]
MLEPIRILFAGELHSSHALNWIDLLSPYKDEFTIRGLHISMCNPPETAFQIIEAKDLSYYEVALQSLKIEHLAVEDIYIHGLGSIKSMQLVNALHVIQEFKPHIIHTLGIFPASAFFLRTLFLQNTNSSWEPFWIVQARGGPDIALNRKHPGLAHEIQMILSHCDYFIADNQQNYSFALDMGLSPQKISLTGPVPGAGGIDPAIFDGVPLPSQKERLILWPKAYNCIQSDGFTVVEALRLALPHIGKFRLVATAATTDVEYWFNTLLNDYGSRVEIHSRLPHEKLLEIYRSARVLLAPSLSDGIPNSMYEAMASHTVPILSPIETLIPLFKDKVHTIYAPNLNPPAIAEALIIAMNNDSLADNIALNNRAWLPTLAGRDAVRDRVIDMYRQVRQLKMSQVVLELIETKAALADTKNQLLDTQNHLEKISQHPVFKALIKVRKIIISFRKYFIL